MRDVCGGSGRIGTEPGEPTVSLGDVSRRVYHVLVAGQSNPQEGGAEEAGEEAGVWAS